MITSEEVVKLLRRVISGEVTIQPDDEPWDDVWGGEVPFTASDGWQISIYNDGDEAYYVDSVTAPDGRLGNYQDWTGNYPQLGPLNVLDRNEYMELTTKLKAAKRPGQTRQHPWIGK